MLATTRPYSRKGGKQKGRILRGHTYDHNPDQLRCGGSIPTRFQRILMPRDSVLVKTSTRFNDGHFYKSLFNKDPGPGSYKPVLDSAEKPSFSRRGYGNGFLSQESRSTISTTTNSSNPEVGPGKYSVESRRCKGLAGKVFAYTGRRCIEDDEVLKLNIPFDENNPLNYVKPITLNVYLKPTMPGPGEYETEKTAPPANVCRSAFVSATDRLPAPLGKDDTPGAAHYHVKSSFETYKGNVMNPRGKSVGRQKKTAVTYDWLGDGAEAVNKSYTQRPDKDRTEIVRYGMLDNVQKRHHIKEKQLALNNERLLMAQFPAEANPTPAFIASDVDRFGEPIRPKRPLDLRPGPGEYDAQAMEKGQNAAGCTHIFRGKEEEEDGKKKETRHMPGPAFYNPQREPAKLSFHLNINRKWV